MVLATRNAGKAREFGRLLEGGFVVEALRDDIEMPEETGSTFRENARIKAEGVFAALGSGCAVLADDSGLEVDALGGRPGVYSARFAGEGATDAENVAKLLTLMEGQTDRRARFACSLCLITPESALVEVSGTVEGEITDSPRGSEGFGYDPVFQPQGWRETLAEAAVGRKDEVSHRGAAARALLLRIGEDETAS